MRRDVPPLRILVVDDEFLIRYVLAKFLEKNAVVKTAATAEEALNEIRTQHFDLCFLDIFLPGMTGLELMKLIDGVSPHTKVVIMTGSLLDEDTKRRIEDNAFAFVEKPFELSGIREIIKMVGAAQVGQ